MGIGARQQEGAGTRWYLSGKWQPEAAPSGDRGVQATNAGAPEFNDQWPRCRPIWNLDSLEQREIDRRLPTGTVGLQGPTLPG